MIITFWYHLTASQGAVLDWFQFSPLAQFHAAVPFEQQVCSDNINTVEVQCSTLLLGKDLKFQANKFSSIIYLFVWQK